MILYIKNMVCNRCVMVVQHELEQAGLTVKAIGLGEAEVAEELSGEEKKHLAARFESLGFELLGDRKSRMIEAVKHALLELVYSQDILPDIRLSEYLAGKIPLDYKYLSSLFSENQGRTIEKYFIAQKIERAKELLVYDELTLSEIAFKLGYSSVAHLSAQFKRVTGLTPSAFKRMRGRKRCPLDEV